MRIEEQVATYLYRSLLKREPDSSSLENCIAFLKNGGAIDLLHEMIVASDEYKILSGNNAPSDHPLAHIDKIWQKEYISYFTHRGSYRPLSLAVETVNICNNDCVICPYSDQTRRKQHMPMRLFEKLVDQYTEIGGGPIGLTPMVGEVLLDKMLLERLKILHSAQAITEISAISNASMAYLYSDNELAEILSYFDRITISIYGLDVEEFKFMTRKDEYDRFRAGLVRILSIMGPERVTLGARHLKKRSENDIAKWAESLARDAQAPVSSVKVYGTREYANWSHFDTSTPLPFDAIWLPVKQNTSQCALPLISAQILSDGTTSFCGCANFDGKSELNLGNISEMSLKQMLGSDSVRRLWDWARCGIPDFCRTCSFHIPVEALADLPSAFAHPLRTFGG